MKLKMKDYIILFIGIFAIVAFLYFRVMYSTISLSQSIYHTKVPIEGTNLQIVFAFLARCFPAVISSYIVSVLLIYNYPIKPIFVNIFKNKIQIFPLNYLVKYISKFSVFLILLACIGMCFYLDIGTYLKNQFVKTNLYEDYYINSNNVKLEFPNKKRNLIYIYLESMENTYADISIGGNQSENLIPELSKLALDNINFSNSNLLGGALQVADTDWTAAALIAQTSGLPLSLGLTSQIYSKDDYFFPKTKTLGDILKDNGYKNVFMLGSDANFGGRKSYFLNHGSYEILDLDAMKKVNKLDSDYYVWWGYEDNKLFDFAKDELTNLANSNQPFNFTMLTADTHFIDGYLEKDCKEKYTNNISNVVACSSSKVYTLISWIQNQEWYDNTTIIISGDHLYMDSYYLNSKSYTRTIYNAFINSSIKTDNNHNRYFSTLDMFPTTLASLGVKIEGNRLGLGTNLFSDEKTLIEKLGYNKFNNEIEKDSYFYDNLLEGKDFQ